MEDITTSSSSSNSNGNATNNAKPPAKTYKFQLDGFQKEAIGCIDRGESVLVSA